MSTTAFDDQFKTSEYDNTIVEIIRDAGAKSDMDVIAVLEDGSALAALGITDSRTQAVEYAHAVMLSRVNGNTASEIADHFAKRYPGASANPHADMTGSQLNEVVRLMRRASEGSFANAIGDALLCADSVNTDRLIAAFPELIAKYRGIK